MYSERDNNGNLRPGRTAVFVGMGANLGDRRHAFMQALTLMARIPHTMVIELSPLCCSDPVDGAGPGEFLNGVARLETALEPEELLTHLETIEQSLGRTGKGRNGPRTIDLDILLFGHREVESEKLVIPHPKMIERAFVLGPFNRLAPDVPVPPGNRTIADYWRELNNKHSVRFIREHETGHMVKSATDLEG